MTAARPWSPFRSMITVPQSLAALARRLHYVQHQGEMKKLRLAGSMFQQGWSTQRRCCNQP